MTEHYQLLMGMGKASVPITSYYNSCFPTYISYTPTCTQYLSPPCPDVHDLEHDDLVALITEFTQAYPGFSDRQDLAIQILNLSCLYPSHMCIYDECYKARAFLLFAHYLTTLDDNAGTIAAVSSSHVGDVSISYDSSATQGKSPFFLWLNRSPYGRQLLTILSMNGMPLVI